MTVDEEIAARLLADAWRARDRSPEDQRLIRRLKFASVSVDVDEVIADAARGKRSLADIRLERALRPEIVRVLDRDAPDTLPLPSGRTARLDYNEDGTVGASAKLQELFGLGETPRVGPRREPVRPVAARPEWTPGSGHARLEKLLGSDLSRSSKGTKRALSEASLAGRSVECATDGARDIAPKIACRFSRKRASLHTIPPGKNTRWTNR